MKQMHKSLPRELLYVDDLILMAKSEESLCKKDCKRLQD